MNEDGMSEHGKLKANLPRHLVSRKPQSVNYPVEQQSEESIFQPYPKMRLMRTPRKLENVQDEKRKP